MPMITTNDLKNGMTLVHKGVLHQLIHFQHIKPGKGPAFVRTKMRNIESGSVVDHTFRAKEPIEQAIVEKRALEYLYRDASFYYVMDPETYDQIPISPKALAGKEQYMIENTELLITFHGTDVIDVQLPDSVVLEVTQAPPGIKGDTASGATKAVTLETGGVLQVPLFVNEGDKVRVDTRSGAYIERA